MSASPTTRCAGEHRWPTDLRPVTIGWPMKTWTLLLAQFGSRIGTRSEGRTAQEVVWRELSRLPEEGILSVDLSGIEVLSGSFADEALVEPTSRLVAGELPGRYILIQTPTTDLVEDLAAKLSQRKLALLAAVGEAGAWEIVGRLPPYLAEALAWVIAEGEATSQDLVQELRITLQNASTRLAELARLRLVHMIQEPLPAGGIQRRARALLAFNPTT